MATIDAGAGAGIEDGKLAKNGSGREGHEPDIPACRLMNMRAGGSLGDEKSSVPLRLGGKLVRLWGERHG